MLSVRNLNAGYGGKSVLRDVTFSLSSRGISVLIGRSGAGKTTLLRCMSMLDQPTSGEITIDDITWRWPNPEKGSFDTGYSGTQSGHVININMPLANSLDNSAQNTAQHLAPFTTDNIYHTRLPPPWPRLTAVFQQLFLWPHLTLRENICLPARLKCGSVDDEYLRYLTNLFEMDGFIDRYPNESSLGQRQRIALARALMLKPRYLLLDEITSALDVEHVARLLKCLQVLRNQDIAIFVITHSLSFARDAADRVVFLDDGTICEISSAEILDNPRSQRLRDFLSVVAAAR